ncbi:MAG: hypothetical protein H5T61_06410 [Thermoflexales bacterium]|nr:hypothetical protein [Thermoflexales bacterium]
MIAALRWYLVLQLFGLAALPLALRLFRGMPGRGYAFARPLGLMVGGYLFWLLSVFGWLPNTPGGVVAALLLVTLAGVALWLFARPSPDDAVPGDPRPVALRHMAFVEILFALAFALWCVVRAYMPRIETAGGEKWMEIAFLNAVLRAPRFPPHDPWLSGFAISYYYFGYVMMGMLTHLAAVPSTIAFNLGIATLFALTVTGAYGLVYALLARDETTDFTDKEHIRVHPRPSASAHWAALLGPLLLVLMGNLEGVLEVFHARGLFPAAFWEWLDIRSINVAPPPFAEGSWMPNRFMWWWQASRVLHDTAPWSTPANPVDWEVIDEFPAFSFILGDMHPHLLSLPFVLLALALALNLFFLPQRTQRTQRFSLGSPILLLLSSLCLGGLGFLNTWDLPVYFALFAAAFLLTAGRTWQRTLVSSLTSPSASLPLALLPPALLLLALLLYLPFWLSLRSQASGVLPNLFNPTRLPQFLVMFGPLLFPIVVWTVARARERGIRWKNVVLWTLAIVLGLLVILLFAVLVHPQGRLYLAALRGGGPIPGLESVPDAPRRIAERLLQRFLTPWTALGVAALLVLSSSLPLTPSPLLTKGQERGGGGGAATGGGVRPPCDLRPATFVFLLVAAGAALTLAVEFFYLRDHFGIRMNTVFKFYFQAWTMWGIAAAYALARLGQRGPRWAAWVSVVLVALGLVYPALAIPTRAREYGGPPTLDGAAYLRALHGADMAAIDWLNAHVEGTPVILEAPGDRYRAYVYEGRVSAFTGLPTLLGWGGHEHQWRGTYDEPARREPDIQTLYTTTDPAQALSLLKRYGIQYVYVGPVERSRYSPEGLEKFAQIGEVVYDAGGVRVFRIP